MYCPPCKKNHSVNSVIIAQAFMDGEAQIVTPKGVKTLCLRVVQNAVQENQN